MHISKMGTGPDLVLVHGWSMHSGVWQKLAEGLASSFTLHLVDLPGHGHSHWHDGDFELDSLLARLAELTPEHAYWMGWSLGGGISLALAERYPDKVSKLVLMAATPRFVRSDNWPCAMEASIFENFAASLDCDQQQTLQRFLMLQAKGAEQSRETIRQLSEQLAAQHQPNPEALQAGLRLLLELDMRAALATVSCPVKLILGQKDTLIPSSLAEAAKQLNPNVQVELIKGTGHAPFITQPTRCQQEIERFIHG